MDRPKLSLSGAEDGFVNSPVTVVIPCFNQGHFLGEAIDSVLAQTYRPLGAIVVDDGSTDCTQSVAQSYPTVCYLSQPNHGVATARNTGLQASAGCYVLFLDADDRLLPDAIALGVDCLTANPNCGFAAGYYREISADGSLLSEPGPVASVGDDYADLLRCNWVTLPGAVLFRRRVFREVGLWAPSLQSAADYDMLLRVARIFPVSRIGCVTVEYRRQPNQSDEQPGGGTARKPRGPEVALAPR